MDVAEGNVGTQMAITKSNALRSPKETLAELKNIVLMLNVIHFGLKKHLQKS